jgi:glycosyltransferase involved in cell wall biosynthesis
VAVDLSVVTPVRDAAPVLARCLDAIAHQSLHPRRYEVVVVDDGSGDATPDVLDAARRAGRIQIRVFRLPHRRGIPAARNLGVREARAPLVVFLDGDELAPPGFLAAHLDCHARFGPRVICRGPVILTDSIDRPFARRFGLLDLSTAYFDTDNSSVAREHLVRAGLFDERFSPYGWEGLDLGFRLKALGLRRVFRRDAAVYHYRPPVSADTLPRLLAKEEERAETALRFLEKNRTLEARFATCATPLHVWLNAVQRGFGVFHRGNAVPWVLRLERWGFPGAARVLLAGVLRSRYFACLNAGRAAAGDGDAGRDGGPVTEGDPAGRGGAVGGRGAGRNADAWRDGGAARGGGAVGGGAQRRHSDV